jgi:excinuclease ABC subunit C
MARLFDRQLGDDFLATVPQVPGVYRVLDKDGAVVYVGKAVNLRRRLTQYRNASRRKIHRKMREIVRSAASITFEPCDTELEAELRETELIQDLRPRWNVVGAFSFLYPLIGLGQNTRGDVLLALSTAPEERADLSWHGAYRSRETTAEAFFALLRLAGMVGHRERASRRPRGTRTWCFEIRKLDSMFCASWSPFLRGESRDALTALVIALTDKPRARRESRLVSSDLLSLDHFYRQEAAKLATARASTGDLRWPIPQADRDALFIRARALRESDAGS